MRAAGLMRFPDFLIAILGFVSATGLLAGCATPTPLTYNSPLADFQARAEKGLSGFVGEVKPITQPVRLAYAPFDNARITIITIGEFFYGKEMIVRGRWRIKVDAAAKATGGGLDWSLVHAGLDVDQVMGKSQEKKVQDMIDEARRDFEATKRRVREMKKKSPADNPPTTIAMGPGGEVTDSSMGFFYGLGLKKKTDASNVRRIRMGKNVLLTMLARTPKFPDAPVAAGDTLFRFDMGKILNLKGDDGFLPGLDRMIASLFAAREDFQLIARGLATVGGRRALLATFSGGFGGKAKEGELAAELTGYLAIDLATGLTLEGVLRTRSGGREAGKPAFTGDSFTRWETRL